jgi:hypothetical protein
MGLRASPEGKTGIMQVTLSFFRVRQYCYNGSPNHVILARAIGQNFAPRLARKIAKSETDLEKTFLGERALRRKENSYLDSSGSERTF